MTSPNGDPEAGIDPVAVFARAWEAAQKDRESRRDHSRELFATRMAKLNMLRGMLEEALMAGVVRTFDGGMIRALPPGRDTWNPGDVGVSYSEPFQIISDRIDAARNQVFRTVLWNVFAAGFAYLGSLPSGVLPIGYRPGEDERIVVSSADGLNRAYHVYADVEEALIGIAGLLAVAGAQVTKESK